MENNKKQTAVEWFQEQIIKIVNGTCELSEIKIFEQAKEMEKEQIMTAFSQGDIFGADFFDRVNITAEQYYKQTYESKNKN